MSAAGDLSAAAQHLPDIERRRCWSILEAGFLSVKFHWFLPRMPSDQKNERWLCTRRSSFYWKKRVMAPFRTEAVLTVCTEMIRPDRAQTAQSVSRLPPCYTVLHALQRSDPWKLNERCMSMRWNMDMDHDRSRKRAHTQWARMPLILKRNLKLLGGFIGNGELPPPPPLCTRLFEVRPTNLWYDQGSIFRGLLIQWYASAVCNSLSDSSGPLVQKFTQNRFLAQTSRWPPVEPHCGML